jgi:aminocarboxymuconate-semialdehyde decarboxylase
VRHDGDARSPVSARSIDIHAHFVPPRALERASAEPERYGVRRSGGSLIFGSDKPTPRLHPLLTRIADRPTAKVDVQLLGNWMDATGYTLPAEQGAAWSRLFNEELASVAGARPESFRTLATLPMQDGVRAAEELEFAVTELGMRGAMIGTNIAGRNLDDPAFDPVWRRASSLRAPIVLHPYNTIPSERLMRYYAPNLLGNPYDTLVAASTLIFGRVCDRFPDLRIVLLHGGGHLPYQIGRLQHGYGVRQETKGAARPPLEYLRWFSYDTLVHLPQALRYLIDLVGPDRVLLGSDDPFDMGDLDPASILGHAGCSATETRHVLTANAEALFALS